MTRVGKNYGDALYELARDEGLADELLTQLRGVRTLFAENPDYARLLSAPNLRLPERLHNLDEAFFGRIHPYLLSFLKILVEQGYISELGNCTLCFIGRYNDDHGILEATAVTAVPIQDALLEKLAGKLSALTGQRVSLQNRVDGSVLGGVRLEYAGKELDGTLRRRLAGIEKTLSETVL